MARRIGVLTGGGDCPGLNAVIRAIVHKGTASGYEIIGIKDGWKGLRDNETMKLNVEVTSGILARGGTVLGTSRLNPYKRPEDIKKTLNNFKELRLDALIACGGEDTLGVVFKLYKEGFNVVGVPKTIDNDLSATDYTFGFDSAINIAMEAIDRLQTTAESHHRIIVAEIMGRHAGWLALEAGMAGGVDIILIPEILIDINEVCRILKEKRKRGKNFGIVAVAEGAKFKDEEEILKVQEKDSFGHVMLGGIGKMLADRIEELTGFETRHTVFGHIQRGGSPTAFDRILGTRFGVKAVELVAEGKFGRMVSLRGTMIEDVTLEEAVGKLKTVDLELYETAKLFFG